MPNVGMVYLYQEDALNSLHQMKVGVPTARGVAVEVTGLALAEKRLEGLRPGVVGLSVHFCEPAADFLLRDKHILDRYRLENREQFLDAQIVVG